MTCSHITWMSCVHPCDLCEMTQSYDSFRSDTLIRTCKMTHSHITWMSYITHKTHPCHVCEMTHPYDSFRSDTLIHTYEMTHSRITWLSYVVLNRMCEMTHSYDSFTRWPIHMIHSHVDSFIWFIHMLTHSYDSFIRWLIRTPHGWVRESYEWVIWHLSPEWVTFIHVMCVKELIHMIHSYVDSFTYHMDAF